MVSWLSEQEPKFGGTLLSVNSTGVVVETVKKAEKENALIVRMYEYSGCDVEVNLSAKFSISRASECDLLERDQNKLKVNGNRVRLNFKPFEIKTVKLVCC